MAFCEEYKEHGMIRVWVGPVPIVGIYKENFVEVFIMLYQHSSYN